MDESGGFRRHWREIASRFLQLGATSCGGPATMGSVQAELQEKRRWVSRERFLEGLSLVNMLPGAPATQLGIFLGYARGGRWGALLGGACFVLPGFFVVLVLTLAYASLGVTPLMRGALYGLGPGARHIPGGEPVELVDDLILHECDGLALGQFTPGPILLAAYVGYQVAGDTPERYFLARREALSITATSGNDCAAAAAMGGSHPVAANAIPTRL